MLLLAIDRTGMPERLILNSSGGSVEDALFIADVVRTRRIETVVPAGSTCQSACVFIFFAGVGREAVGELGVHRPSELTKDNIPIENALFDTIAQTTLRRFGASAELVDLTWATPITEMHILTPEEIISFGVNRTREEGLRLAAAEDLPAPPTTGTTADPLELVANFEGGADYGFTRAGQPYGEIHAGAVAWEIGERQGVVLATVAVPALNIAYQFAFGPVTDTEEPYIYGAIAVTKFDANGPAVMEATYQFAALLPVPEDPEHRIPIGNAAVRISDSTVLFALPRITRELVIDRLQRAGMFQLELVLDGAPDDRIFLLFSVNAAGRTAFERAFPAWTTP
jgi:hypothetical protein